MKTFSILTLCVLALTTGCAQIILPEWKVTVQILDENGLPLSDVRVDVGYDAPPRAASKVAKKSQRTDTNGVAIFSARSQFMLGFGAYKEGYYPTLRQYELGFTEKRRHEPWNPTLKLVLKKMGTPVPMYARKCRIELPKAGEFIGFDLAEFDWVAPYGKGKRADLIFKVERQFESWENFEAHLRIGFPNVGDGILAYPVPIDQGSTLRMPARAPDTGYLSEWNHTESHKPGAGWKSDERKDQNYFFRVRTVLDKQGNIKSALYGKIHGEIQFDVINSKTAIILFQYYLNPEPNSRNMEFDPQRNLLTSLKLGEQVDAP